MKHQSDSPIDAYFWYKRIGESRMGSELALSIFGAVSGAIGAASGYYAFLFSGYRLKCHIGPVALTEQKVLVKLWPPIEEAVSDNVRFVPDSLQFYVDVWNGGRMPVAVDQLRICQLRRQYRIRWRWVGYHTMEFQPEGCTGMPHRIDPGSSCRWLISYEDVIDISEGDDGGESFTVRAGIYLGDGKLKVSKNGLDSSSLKDFKEQWRQHMNKQISSIEVLD